MKITINDVLAKDNLNEALKHISGKKNSCGIDNIMVDDFAEYWKLNSDTILDTIRRGEYQPAIILEREQVRYNGKRRRIYQYTCTDRLILRAIVQILEPKAELIFEDCSHAYRHARGVETAVRAATEYMKQNKMWVSEIDISHFFDSIPLRLMEKKLNELVHFDSIMQDLLKKYLYCRVERNGKIHSIDTGLIQGSPLSPLLSNLYLTEFDHHMMNNGYSIVRFSDDINIYANTDLEAGNAYEDSEELLHALGLQFNSNKSGVYHAINRSYLGYSFRQDRQGNIFADKQRNNGKVYYSNWHCSALQRIGKNYHIVNNGIITRKDYSLLFENESGKMFLPVEMTDSLNIYSNVIFTANFFQYLSRRKVRIAIFDKYGNHCGSFCSAQSGSSGRTMLKQAAIYLDSGKRLQIAKKLDMAAMHNIRANLKYYRKKLSDKERLDATIASISAVIQNMNETDTIDHLLLLEARGRQEYYQAFNEIITDDAYRFEKRTKRPPRDCLNALISFGNTYMYNRISTEIHKTSLDIRVGILHSTNSRAESLNLDIAELFKPIIVDRSIFTVINKKMLQPKEHFVVTDQGGIYLNRNGKKIFLEELESKLYQTVKINGEMRTYEYLIREEVQKILRYVLRDEVYKPYKYTT